MNNNLEVGKFKANYSGNTGVSISHIFGEESTIPFHYDKKDIKDLKKIVDLIYQYFN